MNTGKCSVEVLYFNVTVFVQYLNTHYNTFLSPIFKEKKLIDLKDANKKKHHLTLQFSMKNFGKI
jgi:hypothetical protein